MKKLLILTAFVFVFQFVFSQESGSISQELFISLNKTAFYDSDHQNKMGFSLGYHYLLRSNKMIGPMAGIEFNLIRYFSDRGNFGQMYSESDIDAQNYDLSIPLGIQLRIDKFFVEAGVFIDVNLHTRSKSTVYDYYYNDDGNPAMNIRTIISDRQENPSIGISGSVGYIVPKTKDKLLIKAEYKNCFNDIYRDSNSNIRYLRLIIGYKI